MEPPVDPAHPSLVSGWSRIERQPGPSSIRRRLGALAFLGPIAVGLFLALFGGWRFAGGAEAGGGLAMFLGGTFAIVALVRGDPILARASTRFDLTRHRWLWIPLIAILAAFCGVRFVLVVGDWVTTPDRLVVTIE